ncbi:hypothetical protein RND81_08G186200 [Saponaria officinalis]|uniref:U3 small nucleolar RNA-associated protein 14 n=1 Tax=Saponaria officinalis TaxID=3572 RepID=A0AAW1JA16_SAPOF
MADNKRRSNSRPNSNGKMTRHKKGKNVAGKTKSTGPRLPAALRKQLDVIRNPNLDSDDDFDDVVDGGGEDVDSDEGENVNDFYEYEEEVAEEESKKNRRYDPVDNFEYQLPEKFKDEDILSEDDNDDGIGGEDDGEYDKDSDDDERHARMLQDITSIPVEAFEGNKRKRKAAASEAYPESEFNPSCDVLSGDGQITIHDLLDPLSGTTGFTKLSKKIKRVEKKGITVQTPLPKPDRERVERATAYDHTKEELTKWEAQIKRNREARTLVFDNRNEIRAPTVGTIATEFKPRTNFEKTISSLMHDDEIMDAYRNDGTKLLEMNKISIEDVKDRQDRLAKMRSLLFRHELKAKQIKKIKSKAYHRIKKKDKLKSTGLDQQNDPDAVREHAEKQERMRAEARMTLRHKNQGKWAKRKLERGLDKQDEGTRAAISEQLHLHNLLTRKIHSVKDGSSSDGSTDEDDEDFNSSDEEGASKLVAKAKEKTLRLMEQDEEVPDSGVFSLPFMVRGMEKRKEAADEEAKRALEEYEISLNEQEGNARKGSKHGTLSGRRVFGAIQTKVEEPKKKERPEVDNYGSDNEDIIEENDTVDVGHVGFEGSRLDKDDDINLDVLREDLDIAQESALECVNDIVVEDRGPRTSLDVSVFTAGSWKKMKTIKDKKDNTLEGNAKRILEAAETSLHSDVREVDEDSDSDSGGKMVDGMLSSGPNQAYELPSNEELIRRAFAGDDVEEEFQKAKEDVLNEENPEPEKPLLLPGWGQWASVQKKKGMPSWMSKEHADAKQKRDAALKKRKDARLNHVIISEKVDKKAEKFHLKTLPYPFTSKEVYDRSNRMPLGPEYNPATVAGALTRPEVVKKSGVIIPPISFEEVDPHERGDDTKQGKKRRKPNVKSSGKKPIANKRA